ncbi:MAG TPA: WG repeat-containing protein [Candidatus Acidoferrales bacterium]|nr:WG repeat-containing protein [Candidatus Acidoferrales bacterium]
MVLMREDGSILTTEHYCHAGEYGDGLIRFQTCGPAGVKESIYLTREGRIALKVRAPDTGDFSEGMAPIQDDKGTWGYMDKEGKVLIAPRFEVGGPFGDGLAPVKIEDKWHYIDNRGQAVFTPQSSGYEVTYLDGFKFGAAHVVLNDVSSGAKASGLIDRSGKWVASPTPYAVGELGEDGLAAIGSASGNFGFVDRNGRPVIPALFTSLPLAPFQEGLGAVYIGNEENRKGGFINTRGEWAIRPTFEGVRHFCDGLAPVEVKNRWGFVDRKGQVVIAPQYEEAQSFDAGIADVFDMDQMQRLHHWLINRQGAVLYRSSQEIKNIEIHEP